MLRKGVIKTKTAFPANPRRGLAGGKKTKIASNTCTFGATIKKLSIPKKKISSPKPILAPLSRPKTKKNNHLHLLYCLSIITLLF
jgi:hypothetical protein